MNPCPKPEKRPKSSGRSRIKPKNYKRRKAEFARAYGSAERVEWVRGRPCVACGRVGFADNAHVATGGVSRKADYRMIAPLCGHLWSIVDNCHGELHRIGKKSFEAIYGIDLDKAAADTETAWLQHTTGDTK